MPENLDTIYQSGEKVPFSGTFEIIGVSLAQTVQRHERAICELKTGDVFAAYEGMEVCWHVAVGSSKRQATEPAHQRPLRGDPANHAA